MKTQHLAGQVPTGDQREGANHGDEEGRRQEEVLTEKRRAQCGPFVPAAFYPVVVRADGTIARPEVGDSSKWRKKVRVLSRI